MLIFFFLFNKIVEFLLNIFFEKIFSIFFFFSNIFASRIFVINDNQKIYAFNIYKLILKDHFHYYFYIYVENYRESLLEFNIFFEKFCF